MGSDIVYSCNRMAYGVAEGMGCQVQIGDKSIALLGKGTMYIAALRRSWSDKAQARYRFVRRPNLLLFYYRLKAILLFQNTFSKSSSLVVITFNARHVLNCVVDVQNTTPHLE